MQSDMALGLHGTKRRETSLLGLVEHLQFRPAAYLRAAMTVALSTAAAAVIDQSAAVPNLSLVFLIGVLICAIRDGLGASLFASALSVLSYDFFFLPPIFHFDIADPPNVVAAIVFFASAVLVSNLAALTRRQAKIAEHRAAVTAELQRYSGMLAGIARLDDLGCAATRQVATMLTLRAVLLLPERGDLAHYFAYPPDAATDGGVPAGAHAVWHSSLAFERGAVSAPNYDRLFLPLRTERNTIGLLAVDRDGRPPVLTAEERRLLDALAAQTAVALERVRLADTIDETRLSAETERLRAALLRSISHDLRTPLAAILGAITGLRAYGETYDRTARDIMMTTIQDETERLNRFVGNLLDMTRLESGGLALTRGLTHLDEIVGTALQRSSKMLAGHPVELELAADLPRVDVDFLLFEQILVNLLDNAAKFTPPGGTIRIRAGRRDRLIAVEVIDDGPGIPPADVERVFDPFYRVHATDRQSAGTGLGLAICRGFIEAMGGHITAGNRPERSGAVLTITLPTPTPTPSPVAATPEAKPRSAAGLASPASA